MTGNDYTMPRGFATHFAIAVASDSVGRTADDVGLGGENPKRRRAAAVSIVEFKLYCGHVSYTLEHISVFRG